MIQSYLDIAVEFGKSFTKEGKAASYIPELAKANTDHVGICVMKTDGTIYSSGDSNQYFTIQSISKIMTLAIALQNHKYQEIFEKVKMEPSGNAFNSIVDLDAKGNIPFNPMINSGAIIITSFLKPLFTFEELLEHMKVLCMDDSLTLNQAVYESEHSTGFRNRSIAYLLKSKGILQEDVEETLELYFKLCSIQVTAKSLAGFGLLLANNGVQPFTGERLIDENVVKTIKTLMLTCGMYDGSGEFAVKIGMPAKSGVGGGVLSFVNGRAGIGVFGPSLDEKGNSIAGVKILEYLSKELNLHIFDSNPMI